MTTVLLIRHGFSVTNQRCIFTGQTDVALDEIGVKQALLTARFVYDRYNVDAIYSSDLIRALDTAAPLAEKTGKPIIKDTRLREINGGVWEGKKVEDIIREYPDEYYIWKNNIGIGRPVGGESVAELQARASDVVLRIAEENPDKTVAIFTHACFIRTLQCLYQSLPLTEMKNIDWVPNASVTEVAISCGNAKIIKLAQAKHLESLETVLNSKL